MHHVLSPVTADEIYKALIVLEGCCLLSPYCSGTLVSGQGLKIILKILSEGKAYLSTPSQTNETSFASQLDSRSVSKESSEELWDEIRSSCLDTLQSCVHNDSDCVVQFCEDSSGPDVVCTMLRNKELPKLLRSKCVEFYCILLRLLASVDATTQETHVNTLTEKTKVFLGNKLTKDLFDLWKETELELDVIKCDNFVDQIDERL